MVSRGPQIEDEDADDAEDDGEDDGEDDDADVEVKVDVNSTSEAIRMARGMDQAVSQRRCHRCAARKPACSARFWANRPGRQRRASGKP
jgi:hypothetical protein